MRSNVLPAALLLALAVPVAAPAQTSTPAAQDVRTFSASSNAQLPAPAVVRVPKSTAAVQPADPAALSPLARYQQAMAIRAERYAQEQAFSKKFGAGVAVKLRAHRY